MKNNYVIVRKTYGEVETECFYASSLEEAVSRREAVVFELATEDGNDTSEWLIAEVFEEPISKTDRLFYKLMDWLRNFGS